MYSRLTWSKASNKSRKPQILYWKFLPTGGSCLFQMRYCWKYLLPEIYKIFTHRHTFTLILVDVFFMQVYNITYLNSKLLEKYFLLQKIFGDGKCIDL